jgi:hypothetical protein
MVNRYSVTPDVVFAVQRLRDAPARIAQLWDLAGLGLNFTGLRIAEAPGLTVPGQLAAMGLRLDNTTADLQA